MFPGPSFLKGRDATQDKKAASPAAGLFRVVLNGFKVNHESDDDILEGDGKRDEVYLRADVWVLNRDGSVPYRRSPRSVLMGDINNQNNPRRIAAGTASDDGGLRTNDKFPINEPWRRVRDPLPDRPPMLLWEGTLVQGENMAVIIPTVWEWDSRDPSESEIAWDRQTTLWFDNSRRSYADSIGGRPLPNNLELSRPYFNLAIIPGTRPIGIQRAGGDYIGLSPRVLILTYAFAQQVVRTSPGNTGLGVIALNYDDQRDQGDYTLYVQVEQIK